MEAQNEQDAHRERLRRFLESLPPEVRLAGLTVEQRLVGLTPEETVLCLPDDWLRGLPESFVGTLSVSIRERILQRIGR